MAPCARPCALHTARTSGFIGGAWVGPLRVTQWAGGDRRPHPRGRRTGPGGERRLPDRARFRNRARFTSTPGRRRPGLHEGRRGAAKGWKAGWRGGARADARADARRGRTRGCTSSDTCGAARARAAPYERPPPGASVAPPSREADVALKRVRPPCERALPMPSATTSSSRRPPTSEASPSSEGDPARASRVGASRRLRAATGASEDGTGRRGPRPVHRKSGSYRLSPRHMPLACPPRPVPAPAETIRPRPRHPHPSYPTSSRRGTTCPPPRRNSSPAPPSATARPTRQHIANSAQPRIPCTNFTQESARPASQPSLYRPKAGVPLAVRNGLVARTGTSAPGLVTAW
ncbi:hypothetical protein GA0115257_11531 [Streptomyces sp. LcepLS]|nr:hypothetical protein GA0115257_11531 [Streptomyces sp. LcepLS]